MTASISSSYQAPGTASAGRQIAAGDLLRQSVPSAVSSASRPNAQLLETMQRGRVTSTLLSTLMGPEGTFFRPPSPFERAPRQEPLFGETARPAGARASSAATQPRPSAQLLETMQTGRVASALLSTLMGPAQSGEGSPAFPESRHTAIQAFQMEARAQRDMEAQRGQGWSWTREWFA